MPEPVYRDAIQHVADGEPVDAATVNRPLRQLEGNLARLRTRLDDAAAGRRLIDADAALDPACVVGSAVSWDAAAGRYRPAAALAAFDAEGSLARDPAALCVGLVRDKSAAARGDVTLYGRDRLDPDALEAALGADPAPGLYYLSAATPGTLTRRRTPLGAAVLALFDAASGEVLVAPGLAGDFLTAHAHHAVDLAVGPAGTAQAYDDGGVARVRVIDPDPAQPGWLPAGHASFAGAAPAGAKFGYNLAADPNLAGAFPPIPTAAAALFWDPGSGGGATLVAPGRGRVDAAGIWWFSDCAGEAPWGDPDAAAPGCAPAPAARLLYTAAIAPFDAAATAVTGLSVRAGDPLWLARPGAGWDGPAPAAGPIELRVNRTAMAGVAADRAGHDVYKAYDAATGTFQRGPVVEALRAGGGLVLSGGQPRTGDAGARQGIVRIGLAAAAVAPMLAAEIYRLDGAELTYWNGWPVQLLAAGRPSAVVIKYHVPQTIDLTAARLRLTLTGSAPGGNLPALAVSARRLPQANTPLEPPGPGDDVPVPIDTGVALPAGRYVDVDGSSFPVAPGDRVLVTISHDGDGGEVALLQDALLPA